MAGLNLCVNWEGVTLSVGSYKTVASVLAPSSQRLRLKSVVATANGVSGDAEHLEARLVRVTASSGTGTSVTPQKLDNGLSCAARSTARVNFTAEPTESGTSPYCYQLKFHPQGFAVKEVTFDDAFLAEATEWALQVKVPSGGTAVASSGHIVYEE